MIGRAGVGVDNVDLEAATRAGITVVNAPTGNTIAAAEHTLALLYGVARRIAAADASVRRGEWKRTQFTGLELRGRTLGIVGLGKIGQAIAARARAMEMTVLAADPYVTAEQAAHHGVELVPFDDLLARADVVSVHVPLTRATRGMIGDGGARPDEAGRDPPQRRPRRRRRRGGGRGGAHASGPWPGPASTSSRHEPPAGSPLLDAPNTLLTPHLGASTAEAQVAVAEEVADQVLDVLAGRSARYAVNAPLVTPETAEALAPYLPLAEILGRFFAQFSRTGVKTLTLEIAGELSAFDGSPLVAAVLRGLLETSTTERVNLVNAAALAKARGITVVERKTPDAGAYAAQLTLSGESEGPHDDGRRARSPAARPDSPGSNDYRLDMEPTDVMLITHHRDRPGMIGRIGQTLGEADVNISAMHVGRSAPRADALDGPGPRRRRPARRSPTRSGPTTRSSTCGRSGSGASAELARPRARRRSSRPGSTRPSSSSATASRTFIVEGRFQGQAETRALGDRAAPGRTGCRAPRPPARVRRPCRCPPARRSRSSTRRSSGRPQTAEAIGRRWPTRGRSACRSRRGPSLGSLEIGQGEWEGLHRDEIEAPLGRRPRDLATPPARGVGARRRGDPRRRRLASARRSPASCRGSPSRASRVRSIDRRSPATVEPQATQPWTVVVGHDGIFKVLLLTLFDLPLERFWMWSFDLAGICVIEIRGGRPLVRAMNLTEHLAPLLDEAAHEATEERQRSGRSEALRPGPDPRRPLRRLHLARFSWVER